MQEALYSRPAGGSERYRKISMTNLWRYREIMKDAVPDGTGFPRTGNLYPPVLSDGMDGHF